MKKEKKTYTKPEVKKIKLDSKTAVLGACKTSSLIGPGVPSCGIPFAPCSGDGS